MTTSAAVRTLLVLLVAGALAGCELAVDSDVPLIEQNFGLDCPGRTEHFANVDTFLVIGHRGAAGKAVENTIPSFQYAMDHGANAIELDLCMTADGHVVVWHDWDPNSDIAVARETGGETGVAARPRFPAVGSSMRRPVNELTLEEFRANYWYVDHNLLTKNRLDGEIPTFEQFLQWAADRDDLYYVFFDLKVPSNHTELATRMVATIDSLMQHYKPKFQHVCMTPHETIWSALAGLISGAGLSFDTDPGVVLGPDGDPCSASSSRYATRRGRGMASSVHPAGITRTPWTTLKQMVTCDLIARDYPPAGSEGPVVEKVVVATLNSEGKMECMIDFGVDGIVTDDPALLRAVATRMGR